MKISRMKKVITAVLAAVFLMMFSTANVFAASTYFVKDGEFQIGSLNAGTQADGTITGPGFWTQLNLGDTSVDVPYLHIIVKASGDDLSKAEIDVSDTYNFKLADLGITLVDDEYQDVVLPVTDKGITSLGWCNFLGCSDLVTYTIKDIFLSDDANSSLAPAVTAAPAEDTAVDTAAADVPKTGENNMTTIIIMICLAGCAVGYMVSNKLAKNQE